MDQNQGLPYVVGSGGPCPECGSQSTTFDPTHGHRACETCGNVWANAEDDPDYAEEPLDLGPCCSCLKHDPFPDNILVLEKRAPIPGTGWGCFVCNLPHDGALAVVCDDCLRQSRDLKEAISGYPAEKKRIAFSELPPGSFKHIAEMHERDS
jgi:hypothetical protein